MGTPGGPTSLLPPWRTVVVTLVVLLLAVTSLGADRLARCATPPRVSVNGVEPMTLAHGHVTLVALLTNTCPFCIQQSRRLETMYQELRGSGNDVKMMIIDGGPPTPEGQQGVFESIVSFDVYRDDSQHQLWRQVFKGNKDDILIFNRCGMLTYHISFPYSYLGYNYVNRALRRSESNDRICSACQLDGQDPHDRMMGDAAITGGGMYLGHGRGRSHHGGRRQGQIQGHNLAHSQGHHRGREGAESAPGGSNLVTNRRRNRNRSRCPKNDTLCRELRREMRRYQRFRTAHGLESREPISEREILALLARFRPSVSLGVPAA